MVGFPNKPMGFPTKDDHFGKFWGYHHLRKHLFGSHGFRQAPTKWTQETWWDAPTVPRKQWQKCNNPGGHCYWEASPCFLCKLNVPTKTNAWQSWWHFLNNFPPFWGWSRETFRQRKLVGGFNPFEQTLVKLFFISKGRDKKTHTCFETNHLGPRTNTGNFTTTNTTKKESRDNILFLPHPT